MSRNVHFWGVRGSMPVGGMDTAQYGGHTPCVSIEGDHRAHLVIDAGTGIHRFAKSLPDPGSQGWDFHVLFTHYHLDHIIGLPFFKPLFDPRNRFTFYGYPYDGRSVDELVHQALRPPWFPISLQDVPSSQAFVDLDGTTFELEGIQVSPARLEHPQGVAAYRFDGPERSLVLATDYERGVSDLDAELDRLAQGANVLVHDAQYTPAEYESDFKGWGHSTWISAVEAAQLAGVEELIFTSHDPDRTDDALDAIVRLAKDRFPNVQAAHEGLVVSI